MIIMRKLIGAGQRDRRLNELEETMQREWAAVFKYGVQIQPGSGVTLC
jgi:hypothetical protein